MTTYTITADQKALLDSIRLQLLDSQYRDNHATAARMQWLLELQPDAWPSCSITLSALQLREAMAFAAPDFDSDPSQRETELTFAWAPEGTIGNDEGGFEPAGYVCWLTEYPEEGSFPLSSTKSLEAAYNAEPPNDSAIIEYLTMHRVAVVPEFQGGWDAELYGENETVERRGSGVTPRAAVRSLMEEGA